MPKLYKYLPFSDPAKCILSDGTIKFSHYSEFNDPFDCKGVYDIDKSLLYVCYCDGIGCNASTKGAIRLTELGFQVKELIGGLEWWKFDGYATEGTGKSQGLMLRCAC